ncbi:thioredoxin family protein [Alkalihalobacterium elongatum]|uniref:thioredoxin family protein n=1 Tax=Alkalihalobacterium elongatum TaxID=2675466 RepID=UPI001C1FFABC|nr:thioredoxin family protein [Alkalihalobacterium elongatum]
MKTELQFFIEGKSIQTYMDEMSKLKEESFTIYEKFQLPADGFAEKLQQHHLHFLTITEDWCGDAMMINPIIRKLAEAANIDMRVTLRDADTTLIDRHLTNGGRAIPIILILDEDGTLLGKWGPRAPQIQQLVDEGRSLLPPKEDPTFTERQKEFIKTFTGRFITDETLWLYVYDSFKEKIETLLNQTK